MAFFVSRQRPYYQPGTSLVEVVKGDINHAGPDMLCVWYKREGEGREYTDPREAVEAAIAVCRAWRQDKTLAHVACVGLGGMGLEGEPITFKAARDWAKRAYDRLPKCNRCGAILGKEVYRHELCFDSESFCSEYCAEKDYFSNVAEE